MKTASWGQEIIMKVDIIDHNSQDTKVYKKASIRWQDSARRQFQAGLKGDVGL